MTNRFRLPLLFAVAALTAAAAGAEPLRVVATLPDLGDLAARVGGPDVAVTTLVKGPQDAHFLEPRPSFVRALHEADLFVLNGLELEIGWVPPLLSSARNPKILPGAPGYVDASRAVVPIAVPAVVSRAMGDVHPQGNPHYLTDPCNGLRVAALLRDRFAAADPARAAAFGERYRAFGAELAARLVGAEAARGKDPEAIVRAVEEGRTEALLGAPPGGWLGAVAGPPRDAVEDHALWEYFARRFGLRPVATLEPLPGVAPTTSHLAEVVARMKAERVGLILASVYFDPRHAAWVAERTGAKIVPLAHQVGARAEAGDYLAAIDANVRALQEAIGTNGR
jgi:ABC-type Zn uptake system ZnuABC Zn-binding protein ZnuA